MLSLTEAVLLKILRVAIGTEHDFILPSGINWRDVMTLSQEQCVGAIAFDGIKALNEHIDTNKNDFDFFMPDYAGVKYEWFGHCVDVEKKNQQQRMVMNEMGTIWAAQGIQAIVFKGQAMSLYYPVPFHRAPGDIDVFLTNYNFGNYISMVLGARVNENWYKHSQISWKGELFENHRYLVQIRGGAKKKDLEKTLRYLLFGDRLAHFPNSDIFVPPIMFNALFLSYHGLAHFLSEGICLKQILDWVVFLQKEQEKIDWNLFYSYCEEFHLRRWVDALNDISVHKFGVVVSNPNVVCVSPYSEKILNSVLRDKDFVYRSHDGVWRKRLHILTNMFKYQWKYHQIYQESILKQIWLYAYGFFYKTDRFAVI